MQINKIKLQNWRNYPKFELDFSDITVLVGKNTIGKTNILEAIYYLACARSFRTKDENLVNWEKDFCRVEGMIQNNDSKKDLVVVVEKNIRTVKTVKIKGVKKASSQLLGHLCCVLFTPEEIDLISTLPEARRRYLNLTISQSDKRYALALRSYKKVLSHRNSLLRRIFENKAKVSELEVWDGKLAEYGSELIKKRMEYVEVINRIFSGKYEKLSRRKSPLELRYKPSIRGGWAGFILKLTEHRERDILAKVTTVGPHRDDLEFILNGKNVNEFASRGDFRTIMLALKLSEVEYFTDTTGEKPVLLLDDVFSELDGERRDFLSQLFTDQQTIITTTDLDHISKNILTKAQVVEL